MAIKKPKERTAKEIIKIQPTNATTTSKGIGKDVGQPSFFKVDEQGRPIEQGQIAGGAFQTGQNVQRGQIPEQLTPEQLQQLKVPQNAPNTPKTPEEINAVLAQLKGVLPPEQPQSPPQPQNASIGQINPIIAQSTQPQQSIDTRNAFEKFVNFPKAQNEQINPLTATSEQVRAQTMGAAAGLAVGTQFVNAISTKLAARAAFNTPAEAAHFADKYVSNAGAKVLRGGATEAGKLAVNTKAAGLVSRVAGITWKQLGVGLVALNTIERIFSGGFNDRVYIDTLDRIDNSIQKNDKLIAEENIPLVREALIQEQNGLFKLKEGVSNPEGIDGMLINIPQLDRIAVNRIRARARRALSEEELRQQKILNNKYDMLQEQAGAIGALPPDVREALIEYAQNKRQDISTAQTLAGVQ